MKHTNKKGFTVVELVIVIAIIAVLAAVIIPTFVSLVEKANQSVDLQAVTNMNKILSTEPCETISEAIDVFEANGFDLKNYKPLAKDHYFYFVNGKIILADAEGNVLYPKNADANGQWMSLSGEVPMEEYTLNGSNATVANGAQFAQLMSDYSESIVSGDLVITLPAGEFDLKGTAETFGSVNGNITLVGAVDAQGNPLTTISGIRSEENTFVSEDQGEPKEYGYSIFGKIESGKTVTVQNVIISDVVIKDDSEGASGHAGILAGSVYGTLDVDNVVINNCEVYGKEDAGLVAGFLSSGASVTLNKVTATDSNVTGVWFVAKAIGSVSYSSSVTITDCNFDGVTVALAYDDATIVKLEKEDTGKDGTVKTDGAGNKYFCVLNDEPATGTFMDVAYGLITNEYYWRGKLSVNFVTLDGREYNTYAPVSESWTKP